MSGRAGGGEPVPITKRCRTKSGLLSARFDWRPPPPLLSVRRPTEPTLQGGWADVTTHPASVIETDANPAPLQSLAEGWAGVGRDSDRHMTKEVVSARRGSEWRRRAGRDTETRLERLKTGPTSSSSSSEHLRGQDAPLPLPPPPQTMDPPSLDPGLNPEARGRSEGLVEGECCGGCLPPPAPPAASDAPPEAAGLGCERPCQRGEDVCLTAAEG